MIAPILGNFYFPGIGLLISVIAIIVLGILVSQPFLLKIFSLLELPFTNLPVIKSIYENFSENQGAPENKIARWENMISQDRFLKCRNNKDIKSVKIYKICESGAGCLATTSDLVRDELYIGRVQINTNGGKKRKFLYFQADYIFQE